MICVQIFDILYISKFSNFTKYICRLKYCCGKKKKSDTTEPKMLLCLFFCSQNGKNSASWCLLNVHTVVG